LLPDVNCFFGTLHALVGEVAGLSAARIELSRSAWSLLRRSGVTRVGKFCGESALQRRRAVTRASK